MSHNADLSLQKVILSITGNIATDQRVHKVASSLQKLGMKPILIGRKFKSSPTIQKRTYPLKQINLLFNKGPIFYAEYNFRLFFILLFSKCNVLISNDLDTLFANYLAFRLKRLFGIKIKLVYDSHELFTEVPELNNRKLVKKIWFAIERMILPKLKNSYTVCEPIAEYYQKMYGINMQVIRNLPSCKSINTQIKNQLIIPDNKKIILYQGALNMGRGIEYIIPLMQYIENAVFVIIGTGDIENDLKKMVASHKLEDRVIFTGNLSLEQLNAFTPKADVGLVLQEDISLSYHFVLPNRLFDFINAEVPVLASELPEIARIVNGEDIGITVKGFDPNLLLTHIKTLLNEPRAIQKFKEGLKKCKGKYSWENQEEVIFDFYRDLKD